MIPLPPQLHPKVLALENLGKTPIVFYDYVLEMPIAKRKKILLKYKLISLFMGSSQAWNQLNKDLGIDTSERLDHSTLLAIAKTGTIVNKGYQDYYDYSYLISARWHHYQLTTYLKHALGISIGTDKNAIKRLLEDYRIEVNGSLVCGSRTLREGDIVYVKKK